VAPILAVKNLTKRYGPLVAVNDVSFAIRRGTCFGLLGPNGAGKTTTLEVIENILPPTSGDVLYKGRPRTTNFKSEVGIQFQHTSLLAMLTVWETLHVFKALYENTENLDFLVEQCQLEEFKHQRHENLSGGQRQRFLLALALINRPQLLFLDEPSTGLDPQARRNLWHIVHAIKASGKTIILTTHYMEEAQHLCDEVAIMDHGRVIAQGAPDDLIRTHGAGVTVVLPRDSFRQPPETLPLDLQEINASVHIQTSNIDACLKQLLSHQVDLSDMTVHSPNLEHVFLNLTGRHLRD
jgi:ABC-2 type transport system ATP-binding protein